MPVSYVARGIGANTDPLGTEASPRHTMPTQQDGLVIRLMRGTTYTFTGQYPFTAQGMIITDYGDPSLPRPIISAVHDDSASASFPIYGDTIFANVDFNIVDRTGTETSASNVTHNCIDHRRRGGGASPTPLVSAVYLGCGFNNIGNNAINVGSMSDSEHAQGAPVVMVLACDFANIANDAVFGTVTKHLEVGYCTARNFGIRANSNSDFVNLFSSNTEFVWIHDNFVDHTTDDRKHCVMLDVASGQTGGLAIVENNIILPYGGASPYPQATTNVGLNIEMRTIVRNNFFRGSRMLVTTQAWCPPGCEVYGNIFDHTGSGAGNAATLMASPSTSIHNNTYISRLRQAGSTAATYTSAATQARNFRNLYIGFDKAIGTSGPRSYISGGNNRFCECSHRYWDSSGLSDLADGAGDATIDADQFTPLYGAPIKPRAGALIDTMAALDRRVPDFWGRFAPEGIGYIGALMERGL